MSISVITKKLARVLTSEKMPQVFSAYQKTPQGVFTLTLSADDTQKKRHPNGCLYRSGDARALSKHASDVFVAEVCKMREHFGIGKKRRAFQHWTSHGIRKQK